MAQTIDKCEFCGLTTIVRGHHVIPKSKNGKTIVSTCETCESYIHKTWSNNELRDVYNSVEAIITNEGFQKFLKWRRKQYPESLFKSSPGKNRDKRKYS
jgi:hypothetical protein